MTLIRIDTRPGVMVAFYDDKSEADAAGNSLSIYYGEAILPYPVVGRDPAYDYEDNVLNHWLYAVVLGGTP